jgi:pentatricopeptide repeat protein
MKKHQQCEQQVATATNPSQMIHAMIGFTNKHQADDAIAVYESLNAHGQGNWTKHLRTDCKFRPASVFNNLTQCAIRIDRPDLIAPLLTDMATAGIRGSLAFYESTMKLLAAKKYYKEAIFVYTRLEADELEPSPVTLSCLINFAVELGEADQAITFFNRLARTSTPSIRAYMVILRLHSKSHNWPMSVELLRDMQRRKVQIDCLALNVVLATGVSAGQLSGTKKLLEEFADTADVVSYNTVMKGFAQHREPDKAISLLDAMHGNDVKPNAITFNTAIDAAVRNPRTSDAWRVLARMRDAGHAPDKFTCTTLMKGLQNGATPEQLTVILDLLKNVTPKCDSALCSNLFRSVMELAVQLRDPVLTARAVSQMRQQQVMLSPPEYQRLLRSLTSEEASERCCRSTWQASVSPMSQVSVC